METRTLESGTIRGRNIGPTFPDGLAGCLHVRKHADRSARRGMPSPRVGVERNTKTLFRLRSVLIVKLSQKTKNCRELKSTDDNVEQLTFGISQHQRPSLQLVGLGQASEQKIGRDCHLDLLD